MAADGIEPTPGEIWQDAEGTLMCRASNGGWWVFGVQDPIDNDAGSVVRPLARVFDLSGEFVGDRLHYPVHILLAIRAARGEEPTVADPDWLALFTAPHIRSECVDGKLVHCDQEGRTYKAVDVDGEVTYVLEEDEQRE